jgi:hypothetical protein
VFREIFPTICSGNNPGISRFSGMSTVFALLFAALAAVAPPSSTRRIDAPPASSRSSAVHATPRLSSGFRATRISLRWQAPDAGGQVVGRARPARVTAPYPL